MSATEKDTVTGLPSGNLPPPSPTRWEFHLITRSQWESIPEVPSYENHFLPIDANLERWRLFRLSIKQCTVIQNLLANRNSRAAANGQWVLFETNRSSKSDMEDEFSIIIRFCENNSPTAATDEEASEVGTKEKEAVEQGEDHFDSSISNSHTETTEPGAGSGLSTLPVDADGTNLEYGSDRESVLAAAKNTDEASGWGESWSPTIHTHSPTPPSTSDSRASTPVPTQTAPAISKRLGGGLGDPEELEAPKSLNAEGQNQVLLKMAFLGHTYLQANNAKDAKLLLESAIPNLERIFGKNNQHTLSAKFDLANTYRNLKKYKDAIPLLKSLFESRNESIAPDAEEILSSMLSILRVSTFTSTEICTLATYLLQDHKDNLGSHRMETIRAVIRLSDLNSQCILSAGRVKVLYQCVVENHRIFFGQDEQLLKTIDSLVDMYVQCGELDKAESLLRSELEIRKQDFGKRHDRTLETMRSLGHIYMKCGRLEEALLLFQAAENGVADSG